MKVKKNKNKREYKEESEESYDVDNEFKGIEGENILLRDNKSKIKKDIKNFDAIQSELKKYEGKNISYNKLQNNNEDEIFENEDNEEIEGEENNEEEQEEEKSVQEENEDENEEGNEEEKEEENEKNVLKSKPNILNINEEENEEVDKEVKEENEDGNIDENNRLTLQEKMEKQDEQYLRALSKVTKEEIRKAKNIINQKELYETFVGIRIALQNLLSDINSLPSYKNFSQFLSCSSPETQSFYSRVKKNLNQTFVTALLFHKEFLKKQSYPSSEQFNPIEEVNAILKKMKNNDQKNEMDINEEKENNMNKHLNIIHNNLFKIDQKIMNIWYRKTVVNQFQTNNKILKKLSNNDNFCQHILASVDKNMDTLKKKTQKYNNSDLNLLGRKRLSAEEYEYDKEIFNDNDFYNFLLKEFLLNNEKEIDENNYAEKRDENGLVEGRYDLTMRYILNKNSKIKKNVDTKASKNRKIRYDKHEEIINFMIPEINSKKISGRNIMVNSLFGTKKININLYNNEENKEEEEKREIQKLEENDIDLL